MEILFLGWFLEMETSVTKRDLREVSGGMLRWIDVFMGLADKECIICVSGDMFRCIVLDGWLIIDL